MDPSSFENVSLKWWPEIEAHAPKVPILLVGTKLDLRHDQGKSERLRAKGTVETGQKKASELGAFKYYEVSALTQEGLKHVFRRGDPQLLWPRHRT